MIAVARSMASDVQVLRRLGGNWCDPRDRTLATRPRFTESKSSSGLFVRLAACLVTSHASKAWSVSVKTWQDLLPSRLSGTYASLVVLPPKSHGAEVSGKNSRPAAQMRDDWVALRRWPLKAAPTNLRCGCDRASALANRDVCASSRAGAQKTRWAPQFGGPWGIEAAAYLESSSAAVGTTQTFKSAEICWCRWILTVYNPSSLRSPSSRT